VKPVPRDTLWRRSPALSGALRPWLTDRGSLTRRIERRCRAFRVEVVFQGLRRADRDERFLWPARARVLVREVVLHADGRPVVFAHSVVRARDLRGPWRSIVRLGSRPLGAALFADPRIARRPLAQRKLGPGHELYARACAVLATRPRVLWARRSLFVLRGSPILVTEVFLPGILDL
jgi:chorismate--pyruvate lyase